MSIEQLNEHGCFHRDTVIDVTVDPQKEQQINLCDISNVDTLVISDIPNVEHITVSSCHNLKTIRLRNLSELYSFVLFGVHGIVNVELEGKYMINDYNL